MAPYVGMNYTCYVIKHVGMTSTLYYTICINASIMSS